MAISPFEPAHLTATTLLQAAGDSIMAFQITITADAAIVDAPYDTEIILTSPTDPTFDKVVADVVNGAAGVLQFTHIEPTAPVDAVVQGRAKVAGVFVGGVDAPWGVSDVVPLDSRPAVPAAPGNMLATVQQV